MTFETATINYGTTGSFAADDNGLIYDEAGQFTGIESPFVFSTAPDTPNGHIIRMLVSI